jgi:hypothetical protein
MVDCLLNSNVQNKVYEMQIKGQLNFSFLLYYVSLSIILSKDAEINRSNNLENAESHLYLTVSGNASLAFTEFKSTSQLLHCSQSNDLLYQPSCILISVGCN